MIYYSSWGGLEIQKSKGLKTVDFFEFLGILSQKYLFVTFCLDSYTGFDEAGGDVTDDEIDAISGAFDAMGDPAGWIPYDERVGN